MADREKYPQNGSPRAFLEDRMIDLLENGEAFVLAKIVTHDGSTPRTAGTMMVIRKNGQILGTIGGGIVEARVIQYADEVFHDKKPVFKAFHLEPSVTNTMDMICGGNLGISLDYVPAEEKSLAWAKELKEQRLKLRKKVVLVGAGHVSKETAMLAGYVGFETWVMDDRKEFANQKRFQTADTIAVLEDFKNVFKDLEITKHHYVVIVTRGHLHDKTVLKQALKTPAGYIGMIGSKKKRDAIYNALQEEGVTDADLKRVYSPVGLEIGAQSPEEIAVSIVAQLIQRRTQNP